MTYWFLCIIANMVDRREKYCFYCIILLSLLIACDAIYRKNYTLYRIIALTRRDRQILYVMHNNFQQSNFLNGITNEAAIPMHVAVEDTHIKIFEDYLNITDCLYSKYDQYQFVPRSGSIPEHELTDDRDVLYRFNDFQTILNLYRYWETKYPKNFRKIIIGATQEQNDIVILKVFSPSPSANKKPAVFILGGEEGRDWISPAIVLVYVKKLLEEDFGEWTNRFDAYFLPVLNPDGYIYSMYKDRFWAKNRKTIQPLISCKNREIARGINIDRNWLFRRRAYSTDDACSKLYLGHYVSENETSSLSDFLNGLAPRTLAFFNARGFDNLITTPFAEPDKHQINIDTIMEVIYQTCQDMNIAFGKSYYYGITRSLLFNYTGNCADWVKEYLNVPVVATLYMKHFDNVIPKENDIQHLYKEFAGGVNEILSLTTDLYEPLFKCQPRLTIVNINLLLIHLCLIF